MKLIIPFFLVASFSLTSFCHREKIDAFVASGDIKGLIDYVHHKVGVHSPDYEYAERVIVDDFIHRKDIAGLAKHLRNAVAAEHFQDAVELVHNYFAERHDFVGLAHFVDGAFVDGAVRDRAWNLIFNDFITRNDGDGLRRFDWGNQWANLGMRNRLNRLAVLQFYLGRLDEGSIIATLPLEIVRLIASFVVPERHKKRMDGIHCWFLNGRK